MAITIESLYQEYRSNYQDKSEYFIDFYTSNALFLNNTTTFKDIDALRMYMQITCRYTSALWNKSRFNQCVAICNKNLAVIDSEISRLNADEVKDDWYFAILFSKAKSYYYLKDYKISTPIFKQLLSYDPKNELYKDWLNYSKHRKFDKYATLTTILLGIFLIISIIGKTTIPYLIRQTMLVLGLISSIGLSIYTYYLNRSIRKKT